VGQHGLGRLRLNMVESISPGTEPRIAARGLYTG
jgi:hypothetical protein